MDHTTTVTEVVVLARLPDESAPTHRRAGSAAMEHRRQRCGRWYEGPREVLWPRAKDAVADSIVSQGRQTPGISDRPFWRPCRLRPSVPLFGMYAIPASPARASVASDTHGAFVTQDEEVGDAAI